MAGNTTLTIIKPDAFGAGKAGKIIALLEEKGFKLRAARIMHLTQAQAGEFYAVHRERPFYADLVKYMTSGPVVVQVLEGENAIKVNRDLMGATNPKQAAPGTIRADFAASIEENVVHGSDGPATAPVEISFFFSEAEICSRTR